MQQSISAAFTLFFSFVVFFGVSVAAEPAQFDFGDAPDPAYPTFLGSNGARHRDVYRALLGRRVDYEFDARAPDLDIRDDGLLRTDPLTFRVTNGPVPLLTPRSWHKRLFEYIFGQRNDWLFINILIDRDNSGSWQSPAEWAVQNQRIAVPAGNSLEVRVKGTSGNDVRWNRASEGWMRVTLTDARVRNYDGTTRNPFQVGETEDYAPVVEPTEEPKRAIWCFVDEKACRTLTSEESNEARDNKVELKGPYPDNASCVKECGEKTIETPTPRRGFPKQPPEEPKEKTIPTKSPATLTCLGDNVMTHPFDGAINCSVYNQGALEYRCCDSGPVGQPVYACHGASPYEWANWPADSVTECYGTPSANQGAR